MNMNLIIINYPIGLNPVLYVRAPTSVPFIITVIFQIIIFILPIRSEEEKVV